MPWSETSAMDEKARFIRDWIAGHWSVTDFLDGNPPKPLWDFTNQRKQRYGDLRNKSGRPAGS